MTLELTMWEDKTQLTEIKKLFAPKLSDTEFSAFIGMGKASGLNPFLREIWSIKYDTNAPAQIFIGRDGYRKAAQKNSEYDYHQSDAVYANDNFKVIKGEIEHDYNLKNRGELLGAYCVVKRRSSTRPIYVYVDLKEYDTKRSVWKDKPATMLKKVAEVQALRAAFQEQFGGTYSEDEMDKPTQTSRLNSILDARNKNGIDKEVVVDYKNQVACPETGEIIEQVGESNVVEAEVSNEAQEGSDINIDQLTAIRDLMRDKHLTKDRQLKALSQFGATTPEQLNSEQAEILIMQLEKL